MSSERLTAFIGAHELELASASYEINNESIVNQANLSISPDTTAQIGAVVDVKKDDESTNVFNGKIYTIDDTTTWDLEIYSNGHELINKWIEKVYTDISPEGIVADIVNNFTNNLTYIGTAVSGIVLDEYLAQGYAIDIIRHMVETLRWRLTINQNDGVDFDVEGAINNGRVFTNGTDINITSWTTTSDNVINKVRVEAGFLLPRAIEDFSATGTIFELEHKPESSVRVVVSGVEVSSDAYKVEPENNPARIVFDSSVTDPTIEYTWRKRIVIEDQDEDSIIKFNEERFRRIDAPYIITEPDALRFARSIIDEYSDEAVFAVGVLSELNFDVKVNERVTFVDPLRNNKTAQGVISKIKYNYDTGQTELYLNPRQFDLLNWQNGVQDRIKQLERRFSSSDQRTFVRSTTPQVLINIDMDTVTPTFYTANNSLIAGHITLGYARTDENMEVDCSPINERHGVWSGTTIDGDQFVKQGYRLYCGSFAGVDEYCSYTGSIANVQGLTFLIKDEVDNSGIITLTNTTSISIDATGDITTTGLTNETITESAVGGWRFININFDALTVNLLEVGRVGSSYYTGLMDEFCLFNKKLDSADRLQITQKRLDAGTVLYDTHCLLYWAFDNCLCGDFEEEL